MKSKSMSFSKSTRQIIKLGTELCHFTANTAIHENRCPIPGGGFSTAEAELAGLHGFRHCLNLNQSQRGLAGSEGGAWQQHLPSPGPWHPAPGREAPSPAASAAQSVGCSVETSLHSNKRTGICTTAGRRHDYTRDQKRGQ